MHGTSSERMKRVRGGGDIDTSLGDWHRGEIRLELFDDKTSPVDREG